MNIIEQYRELERRAGPMLKAAGMTMTQYQVAEAVMLLGVPTMGETCEYLNAHTSSMTDAADRLERNGIIRRTRSTEDRRAVRLALVNIGWFKEQHYEMQRLQEAIQREMTREVQTA